MKDYYRFSYEEYPFQLFSLPHLVAIFVSIGCMISMYLFREKIRNTKGKKVVNNLLIFLLLFGEVSFQIWYIVNDKWDSTINLPLQLCSLSLYLCLIMLLTRSYRVFEITFFTSMVGAFFAIITPELFFGFPHFRYFQFFTAHLAIVLSCLFMVWIEQYRVTFSSMIRSFVALNIIAFIVFNLNHAIGANYMFLDHKPYNASLIDYLGPYPWYIFSLEGIALFLFSILYLPFFILNKGCFRKGCGFSN
ncbi:YwaF family protein [Bacillus sp. 2205SS5-2]|uniref:YwaF family protein n=1 Tax=Bacillus sp. 2205SS5-2 TaxID=3109031 RepID=UPI003007CACF